MPDSIARYGNLLEAGVWFVVAIALGAKAIRSQGPTRNYAIMSAIAFIAFGGTDLVEAQTGAWWKPPGLLVVKLACVAAIAWGLFSLYRRQRRDDVSSPHEK